MDPDDDVEAVLEQRRAANPRKTPDRTPVGADALPRIVGLTIAGILVATAALILVFAFGRV